jgi:hypothetical protein
MKKATQPRCRVRIDGLAKSRTLTGLLMLYLLAIEKLNGTD